ncbi:hypothetical protein GT348_07180 [Aristophania vespae]|uniref:DUF1311 domain-containing protein n=1 Tax=Aristophania vespae TaxID=2697033 RepID=A0A6P1NBJ9_9PROT|nr:hypothetical protein [Aristophania vespae]QHI96045.1 hypothetical protein GT348_07180 [Aristophania vespae]
MFKLTKIVFGSAALIYCVSAYAKPFTNEDAINEAKNYEFYCGDTHTKSECTLARKAFIKDYQNAYADDRTAQEKVVHALREYRSRDDASTLLDVCAWQLFLIPVKPEQRLPGQQHGWESMCSLFSAGDPNLRLGYGQRFLVTRIYEIGRIIGAHTVHRVKGNSDGKK